MGRIASALPVLLFFSLLLTANASENDTYVDFGDAVYYVVGGDRTSLDEFPFMVALGWTNNATGGIEYLGGGMLIAPNFVLTAAHCVYRNGKLPDVISVGGESLDYDSINEHHEVKNVIIHPEYKNNQAYYDIALFQLASNSEKPPVCLWTHSHLYTKNVTAIGYGLTQFAGSGSSDLLKVQLVVFPKKECNPFFKRQRKFRDGISNAHICAGDPEGKKDTCQGDSGGPLLVEFSHRTYAAGITSTGQACSGFPPAVYTKIASFIGWIESIVREHGFTIRKTCGVK